MKTITLVAFDDFTDIDVFLAWDLFNRLKVKDKRWIIKIVGSAARHISSTGVPIEMQGTIEECNDADVVFFASGSGTRKVIKDVEYLKRFKLNPEKQIICSMCSGSLILAALGLLDGITATTYPTAIPELKAYGVEFEKSHLVIHDNIATAAGCLAALDLVGWVIERLTDSQTKEEVLASVQPIGQGIKCIY